MRRLRLLGRSVVAALASAAGAALRVLPAVGGALLVSYGAWLAWAPAGFLAGGVFLLLLDRRMP
ncbi:hypothetical protein [Streptomyces erythrochromogenes]|uniref:hypothetical protein n=1 Tax=Streptomyces erythrochromogenes TaxID=285574 RepID=UPI0036976057